jgi:ParB family chromosome partitioning protein
MVRGGPVSFGRLKGKDETEARRWEIAENLHRAELSVLERSEHVAEWIALTDSVAQVAPRTKAGKFAEGGVRAAARELHVDRDAASRAVKVASIAPEAKQAAIDAGLSDMNARPQGPQRKMASGLGTPCSEFI